MLLQQESCLRLIVPCVVRQRVIAAEYTEHGWLYTDPYASYKTDTWISRLPSPHASGLLRTVPITECDDDDDRDPVYDGRAFAPASSRTTICTWYLIVWLHRQPKRGSFEATVRIKDGQLTAISTQKGSLEASLRTKDAHILALESHLAATQKCCCSI